MSNQQEGPNPLRPYYIPPSVGLAPGAGVNTSTTQAIGSKHVPSTTIKPSFGSSARDILSDLDYSDYLSDASPSAAVVVKGVIDQALWKYTSVLLAQPFEVAKTVLQVQLSNAAKDASIQAAENDDMIKRPGSYRQDEYDIPTNDFDSDSDSDSPSYFTSTAPRSHASSRSPHPRRSKNDKLSTFSCSPPRTPRSPSRAHSRSFHIQNLPSRSSITATLSHLWTTEGAWGIWKGTNTTFIHSILLSTITSFARSLICAVLDLPDPGLTFSHSQPPYLLPMPSAIGGLDILSSPSPLGSLLAAVGAAGIAGILLAPLDIARTKLMLTPSTHLPRSLIPTLQSLPSWTLPFPIAPVTLLHSTLPTLLSASTPLFLRSRLGIDPVLTPNTYSVCTFISQTFELGVRLPLETVLRRGQIDIASTTSSSSSSYELPPSSKTIRTNNPQSATQTVVEIGPYKGLTGTIYHIIFEEGTRSDAKPEMVKGTGGAPSVKGRLGSNIYKRRKGQGLEGLWRGWRVGMWGLVGVWGAAVVGGGGAKGGEF